MSKYTMQLRAVEMLYGHDELLSWFKDYDMSDYLTQEQLNLIAERLPNWSKDKLAQRCIDKYYMREIGYETPYLFKHMLKVRLDEIMQVKLPYLYTLAIKYDPLVNVDYTESYTKNTLGTNTGTSNNNEDVGENSVSEGRAITNGTNRTVGNNLEVNSDTPQGRISKEAILRGDYASSTSAGESESTSATTGNTEDSTKIDRDIKRTQNGIYNQNDTKDETFTRTMKGNSGVMTTAQKLIEQYRKIVIAVNKEIVDELDDLFIGLLD